MPFTGLNGTGWEDGVITNDFKAPVKTMEVFKMEQQHERAAFNL